MRVLSAGAAAVVLTFLATGWLYWIRGTVARLPGPMVRNALPLDELPGHDGVPLLVFLAVFAVAGAVGGLVSRASRLSRPVTGLTVTLSTWAALLAADAFSLFLVRQVPAALALHAAARLPAVYLAAGASGLVAALLARPRWPGPGAYRALAWLAVAGGLADLIAALLPRTALVGEPSWIWLHPAAGAAHVLLVPAGLILLIAAPGLVRRNRRAWTIAVTASGASAGLQLLGGAGYLAAGLVCVLTAALAAGREAFPFRGDPTARPSAQWRLLGGLLAALVYGVTAFWVYRAAAAQPFRAGPALLDTLRAMTGRVPTDIEFRPGEFADWFPLSIISIVVTGLIWAAATWVRPWRQRLDPGAAQLARAAQIVRAWGQDTLAPFALRSDKNWFVAGQSLLAYRVVRGVALVTGDPVGPRDADSAALDSFLSFARSRGWRTAILGASDRLAATYRSRGLVPVYHGDEAIVDTAAFSLEGRPMRAVRQAVHRLDRGGYRAEVALAGNLPAHLRDELAAVERAWLRGRPRTGFSMELDSLFRLGGADAVFVIGRNAGGDVAGFLHLAACPAGRSLSLSSMPRQPGMPNGLTSWLIVAAGAWARERGYEYLSLNFSPFASLLSDQGDLDAAQRLQRRALLRAKRLLALQLDNLLRFNEQFRPLRQPRYVVVEARGDLPRVALAAMAAEGDLPFAGLVRGRGWYPAGSGPAQSAPEGASAAEVRPAASVSGRAASLRSGSESS